jgi:hypothetical protein
VAVPPDRVAPPKAVDVRSTENVLPHVRRFGACTADLGLLADWLRQCGDTSVARESTGVYWIPLFELLEQRGFQVYLVDPRQTKHAPGRPKTDVLDCQWIQRLHSYGLLTASFRPEGQVVVLRGYRPLRKAVACRSGSNCHRPSRPDKSRGKGQRPSTRRRAKIEPIKPTQRSRRRFSWFLKSVSCGCKLRSKRPSRRDPTIEVTKTLISVRTKLASTDLRIVFSAMVVQANSVPLSERTQLGRLRLLAPMCAN